jgi:hypothetical protein
MSIPQLDDFYLQQPEPNRSCYMALRDIISNCHPGITQEWKYKLPFFYLHQKMFCYLWQDKKTTHPYIGFTDGALLTHPLLVQGDRKRMKVLNIDPNQDIPVEDLYSILNEALALRTS